METMTRFEHATACIRIRNVARLGRDLNLGAGLACLVGFILLAQGGRAFLAGLVCAVLSHAESWLTDAAPSLFDPQTARWIQRGFFPLAVVMTAFAWVLFLLGALLSV